MLGEATSNFPVENSDIGTFAIKPIGKRVILPVWQNELSRHEENRNLRANRAKGAVASEQKNPLRLNQATGQGHYAENTDFRRAYLLMPGRV